MHASCCGPDGSGGCTPSLPTCTEAWPLSGRVRGFALQLALQIAILESQQAPASTMHLALQQQQQQQPQGSLQAAGAASLHAGAGAPNDAQLLQTLLALNSSQQLPLLQQPVQQLLPLQPQPMQQPAPQLGSQGGLWEQRLRAQLASGQGGSNGGMNSLPPGNNSFQQFHLNSVGPQPPAAQQQQPAPQAGQQQPQQKPQQPQEQPQAVQQQEAQQAQQQQQQAQQQQAQQALPVDDAVSMLLNCFPAPAVGTGIGSGLGSDLKALLNSSGSESGDSLLGSLLRAAGGQPGVDDLAAMLSSL